MNFACSLLFTSNKRKYLFFFVIQWLIVVLWQSIARPSLYVGSKISMHNILSFQDILSTTETGCGILFHQREFPAHHVTGIRSPTGQSRSVRNCNPQIITLSVNQLCSAIWVVVIWFKKLICLIKAAVTANRVLAHLAKVWTGLWWVDELYPMIFYCGAPTSLGEFSSS